jgi:hypothetical protein
MSKTGSTISDKISRFGNVLVTRFLPASSLISDYWRLAAFRSNLRSIERVVNLATKIEALKADINLFDRVLWETIAAIEKVRADGGNVPSRDLKAIPAAMDELHDMRRRLRTLQSEYDERIATIRPDQMHNV